MKCRDALLLLLDQIDFTKGACSPTDMVGACIDTRVFERCREAIAAEPIVTDSPNEKLEEGRFLDLGDLEVCRFDNGKWSLRKKLQDDDRAHLRYLNEFEVRLLLSALRSVPAQGMVMEWSHQLNIVRAVLAERGSDPLLVARIDTVLCAMLAASQEKQE